jgi:membrane-associated phospholipid phosphatase
LNPPRPLLLALRDRLRSQWPLKVFLLITLPTVATAAYMAIQRTIVFPVRSVPLTWFDRAIPFQPGWVWVYLSLYLLNPIGPLLTRSRADVLRYARGIVFLFVSGIACFALLPVAGPRPVNAHGPWLYERLITVDRIYNSFPSLHAACAAYSVLFARYASRDSSRPALRNVLLAFAWAWAALILYSTIATRQHFVIDLLPGILLAWLTMRLIVAKSLVEARSEQRILICGGTS